LSTGAGSMVICNGCFDVIHLGHIHLLNYAKNIANDMEEPLWVAVNSDASVKLNKGDKRPINTLEARRMVLEALRMVDKVVSFEEKDPYQLFLRLKPSIIVKGSDYKAEDVVGNDIAKVLICPRLEGYSTTKILETYIK